MTTLSNTAIYLHADHPEWGRGIILPGGAARTDRFDLSFEMGGRRVIMKTYAAKLKAADLSNAEAEVLREKLAVRRHALTAIKPARKSSVKKAAPALGNFDAQVLAFRALFPGTFKGEKFTRLERTGRNGKGGKDPAVATAARAFTPEAFEGSGDEAFLAAAELARNSGLVHPLDGATTLSGISAEGRPVFLAGLRNWLHGEGSEAERFEGFVAAIKEATGPEAKRPSWPLVTMFAALLHPDRHVSVKPTAFQRQATLIGMPLDYDPAPSFTVYQQCLEIATGTASRLRRAGEEPRDLLDVSAFISLTHSPRPAGKTAAPA